MTILGAVLLVGGAVGLLRWLDAWAPWGGLEGTYGGILLVNLAVVLPELAVAATALCLRDFRMAQGTLAASAIWRFGLCGLLAMALPTVRNPLLPGRSLGGPVSPAVVVLACILAYVAAIVRVPRLNDPGSRVLAGAVVLVPYLGCLWLVWRSGMEMEEASRRPSLEADLTEDPGLRPRIWWALGAVLAIGAGGALVAWVVAGGALDADDGVRAESGTALAPVHPTRPADPGGVPGTAWHAAGLARPAA